MSRRRRGSPRSTVRREWPEWAYGGLASAFALVVYLPALANEFVNYDDDRNLLLNPHFRGFSAENVGWMSTNFQLGHFHPLTWYSLAVDYSVWGLNPVGFHLTNAVLHALSAGLLYLVARLLVARALLSAPSRHISLGALAAALLFALHPLRVESVAWASERRDVLSGTFYMATILLYLQGRKAWSYGTFTLALLSKILAATLPLVLLCMDLYPLRRKLNWRMLVEKAPYFALSLAAGLYTVTQFEAAAATGTFADLDASPLLRVSLSLFALGFYLFKSAWPFGLAAQYVYTPDPTPLTPAFVLGGAAFVALAATAFARRRKWPALAAALAAYAVTLAPVLSFLRLDPQQYVSDHHSYLAVTGLCVAAGGWLASRGWPRNQVIAAGAVALVLSALTVRQIGYWHDSVTLWTRALEVSPDSIVAHNNLGRALADLGQSEPAQREFEAALALNPSYHHARYNRANLVMESGDLKAAEEDLRRVLEAEPGFVQARGQLANCLLRQQKFDAAEAEYKRVLAEDPDFADAHFNFGLLLEFRRRGAEAREQYAEALRLDPSNQAARQRLNSLTP